MPGPEHVAERHDLLVQVGDLDADRGLAGDRRQDPDVGRRDGVGDVLGQRGDLLDLDGRADLDLVPRHGRAAGVARDLGVDAELLHHLGEPLDHLVAGLGPRLVRASRRAARRCPAASRRCRPTARAARRAAGAGCAAAARARRRVVTSTADTSAVASASAFLRPRRRISRSSRTGRVVGRVAHLGVDAGVGHRTRRASAASRGPGSAASARPRRRLPRASARRAAEQAVAQGAEAVRHLVDGRRGDHEDAEHAQQREQRHHDVRRAQQVEQQARHHEARRPHRPAGGRWRRRARAAGCRWRCGRCRARRRRGRPSRRPGVRPDRCARGRACCASR